MYFWFFYFPLHKALFLHTLYTSLTRIILINVFKHVTNYYKVQLTSPILLTKIRKSPNISKPNTKTQDSEEELKRTVPSNSVFITNINSHFFLLFYIFHVFITASFSTQLLLLSSNPLVFRLSTSFP